MLFRGGGRLARGKVRDWLTVDGLTTLRGWARDGLSNAQLAQRMGICADTLYAWKKRFPEMDDALRRGKAVVDIQVENALLKRALGYSYTEVTRELKKSAETGEYELVVTKTVKKESPPDVSAQMFWLKNRKPEMWREKREEKGEERPVEAGVAILPAVELQAGAPFAEVAGDSPEPPARPDAVPDGAPDA